MAKNKGGKSSGYVSKGERRSVAKRWTNAVKRERTDLDKLENAWKAWRKGHPTPKLIQRILNVDEKALWKNHNSRPVFTSSGAKDGQ